MRRFTSLEDQWGIRERKVGLDNYNIGFNAGYNFNGNKAIAYNVRKNDPVEIRRYRGMNRNGQQFTTYNIIHNGSIVGQLSRRSSIAHHMEADDIELLTVFLSAMFSIGRMMIHLLQTSMQKRKQEGILIMLQDGHKMPKSKVIYLLLTLPDMANKL